MKSKGLQRLRWYCQVCEKQCRDENGFKCHAQSESHLRQMLVVGENAGRHIDQFSRQFQSEFVSMLSRRYGFLYTALKDQLNAVLDLARSECLQTECIKNTSPIRAIYT